MALRADELDAALAVTDGTGIRRHSMCEKPEILHSYDLLLCEALDNSGLSSESKTTAVGRIVVSVTNVFAAEFKANGRQRGKTAPLGWFPYTCSLRERGTHRHMCGATLFRRDRVMTAAHCVDPKDHETIGLSPIVYCGIHDRRKAEDDQVAANCSRIEQSALCRRRSLMQSQDTFTPSGQASSDMDTTWLY